MEMESFPSRSPSTEIGPLVASGLIYCWAYLCGALLGRVVLSYLLQEWLDLLRDSRAQCEAATDKFRRFRKEDVSHMHTSSHT